MSSVIAETLRLPENCMLMEYKSSSTLSRFHMDGSFVRGVKGPFGCLDSESEFLSDSGWVRMDSWEAGMRVAQWVSGSRCYEFVDPEDYVCERCDSFWHIFNGDGLDMCLSGEHRVPLLSPKYGFRVISADRLVDLRSLDDGMFSGVKVPSFTAGQVFRPFDLGVMSVNKVKPVDGYKYCFRVPSSYFLARRGGRAFITGNSGKSSAMVVEMLLRGLRQEAFGGVRRSRWAVIRNTYPDLKATTIKTFQDWVPQSGLKFRWDSPINARLNFFNEGDGTVVDMEFLFFPLDELKDIRKLLSLELSGAWINEAKEVSQKVLEGLTGRVGRYPSARMGGCSWSGIIMDTNPPDVDHWYYRLAEEARPDGWSFYSQPGGLIEVGEGKWENNPLAENIANLPGGHEYYRKMLGGKTADYIRVFVGGQYGSVADGRAVFTQYVDRVHYGEGEDLRPYAGVPLLLGFDFGVQFSACVMGQLTPKGGLNMIAEYLCENAGLKFFVETVIRPVLVNQYHGMKICAFGDPAGMQRSSSDEQTCFQILRDCGIPITAACANNSFLGRKTAVDNFLTKMLDGVAAFKVSKNCPLMRKGFAGEYMYERVRVSGKDYFKDQPLKNKYSHILDATQYLCMGAMGGGLDGFTGFGGAAADMEVSAGDWGGFS